MVKSPLCRTSDSRGFFSIYLLNLFCFWSKPILLWFSSHGMLCRKDLVVNVFKVFPVLSNTIFFYKPQNGFKHLLNSKKIPFKIVIRSNRLTQEPWLNEEFNNYSLYLDILPIWVMIASTYWMEIWQYLHFSLCDI